jgi:hypothetical protein
MRFPSSAKFCCTAIKLLGGCKIITIIELGFLDKILDKEAACYHAKCLIVHSSVK